MNGGIRMKNFFIKPSRIFEKYKENPKFAVSFIIIGLFTFISSVITYIATKDQLREIALKSAEKTSHGNQEAIDIAVNIATSPVIHVIGSLLTAAFAIGLIALLAFIYYLLVRIFKGSITYIQAISVYSLSYIAVAIGSVLKSVYIVIFGQNISSDKISYLNSFLAYFNIFKIWQIVLLALGLSIVSIKISRKKAIAMVLIVTLIGIGLVLGMAAVNDLLKTISTNNINSI